MPDDNGWSDIRYDAWSDLDLIRARLDAGVDPGARNAYGWSPLHGATEYGSPEVVAELARRTTDLDPFSDGRTPLWHAVFAHRPENARVLARAGADPWLPMMSGWSPGRLSLAGPTPDLFDNPSGVRLSTVEAAWAAEAPGLLAALGDLDTDGYGLACVAGVEVAEAVRRLGASPADDIDIDEWLDDPPYGEDDAIPILGLTDVPGGCVVTQPWGFGPSMPGVVNLLSVGTVCYGLYQNPKSGSQGSVSRDGVTEGWDLNPGGEPHADAPAEEVLRAYLYQHRAVAYACGYVGLRLTDARPVTGPADLWVRLPDGDYWRMS
jgi:hypothetical protein